MSMVHWGLRLSRSSLQEKSDEEKSKDAETEREKEARCDITGLLKCGSCDWISACSTGL